MKPIHYVKKYDLKTNDEFSHQEFISDSTLDFMSIIEWYKETSSWDYKHFIQCVDEMRKKWDAIDNKTLGKLPEKLWSYFYRQVIVNARSGLFPEYDRRRTEILRMTDEELVEYLRGYSIPIGDVNRAWEKIENLDNDNIRVAMQEHIRRIERQREQSEKKMGRKT